MNTQNQNLPVQVQQAGANADAILQPTPPGVEVPPGPGAVGEDWQQKYAVLQGKYNAELPQLQQTNSYLTSELLQLKTIVQDLQQQKATAPAAPAAPVAPAPLDLSSFLNDDQKKKLDEEGITSDVLNMLGQAIGGSTTQQFADHSTAISQDIKSLKGDAAKTASMTFWSTFEGAVPDYQSLNANPSFMEFMKIPVPGTGMNRQQLADIAVQNLDARSAVSIYNEFKQLNPAQFPAATQHLPPQPPSLMSQADPAANLNVQVPPQPLVTDTKIYTKAEVNKFFADVAIGNYKNNPDQAVQYEALIMAACREGRVEGSLQPTR